MESQGAGVQILMTLDLALEMGVPIYAILAGAFTASDRQGRSVPAPGQGILTTAREVHYPAQLGYSNPLLDVHYRRSQLMTEQAAALQWMRSELSALEQTSAAPAAPTATSSDSQATAAAVTELRRNFVIREANRRIRAAQNTWGVDFYVKDPEIAPLRGCLATWGLTLDDLEIASFHGTGTKANDKNESEVVDLQMRHLGRTPGRPLFTVFQKWMTGHPKGAAAAWMLNGVIQSMLSGLVPGNRNADNVDPYLQKYDHLLYTDRTLNVGRPLRAGYLHSFGFGQAGGELVVVHPNYAFHTISAEAMREYSSKRAQREIAINTHWQLALDDRLALMDIKARAPYGGPDAREEKDQNTYLDPTARATHDATQNQFYIPKQRSRTGAAAGLTDVAEASSSASVALETKTSAAPL